MIDSSQIESQIDSDLADNTSRQIKPLTIRTLLKAMVRWVRDVINSNQSTWLRISDNTPGGANNEWVYRTGAVSTLGGLIAKVVNAGSGSAMRQQDFNTSALQVMSFQAGYAAFMEFHVQGAVIHQLGVDNDTVLKFRPWQTAAAYPIVIDGVTEGFTLKQGTGNRKIVLFDIAGNQNQFYGFGIDAVGWLRYHVADPNNDHVFFTALSPTTTRELMRIKGNGNVGINQANPGAKLDIVYAAGVTPGLKVSNGSSNSESYLGFVDGQNYLRGITIFADTLATDKVGIGINIPTAKLHVKAANGHQQFRLETSYVPTGPTDPNGTAGVICWGEDYIYWKTSDNPHRWRRAASSGW